MYLVIEHMSVCIKASNDVASARARENALLEESKLDIVVSWPGSYRISQWGGTGRTRGLAGGCLL